VTYLEAVAAQQFLQEVLTKDGEPVTIDMISTNGFMARITGPKHFEEWIPIEGLRGK
jgi:hypothetical protein